MSPNSRTKKNEKSLDKTSIVVAIIGLASALIVALVSVINNKMAIELPLVIEITKTALAQSSSVTTSSTSNNSVTNSTIENAIVIQTPSVSENQALQWNIVFQDGFDSSSNGWATGESASKWIASTKSISNGKYTWDVKLIGRPGFTSTRPLFKTLDTFYGSVEAKQVSGSDSGSYGFQIRDYAGASFIFQINSQNKYSIVYDLPDGANGSSKMIVYWTELPAINPYAVNNLALISQDSRFYFFVNHQYVVGIENPDKFKGELGLMASFYGLEDSGAFEFDNFEIRSP